MTLPAPHDIKITSDGYYMGTVVEVDGRAVFAKSVRFIAVRTS